MHNVIRAFLTNKAARTGSALSALLVSATAVGGPWNG